MDPQGLDLLLEGMDAWFESMRAPGGYGGPVAHWWRDNLAFTAPGLDWRYQGLILGYLNLFEATGKPVWLGKACRAGDDLVDAQLPGGNYPNSCFEFNPGTGGNPHEAACDLALFRLAQVLFQQGLPGWKSYYLAADSNLQNYLLEVLWDPQLCHFRNAPGDAAFVPNKAATIAEAIMAQHAIEDKSDLLARFVIPTLDEILRAQINASDHKLHGAIDQALRGKASSGRYFPFYIARCIPPLLEGHYLTGDKRYRQAAWAAMGFILRQRLEDGSFPQVIYSNGRVNRYPQWVAGVGDILRAMELVRESGMEISIYPTLTWMLGGRLPNGGLRTAHGFSSYLSQRPPGMAELRDILPVCGWVDKAFHYLSAKAGQEIESIHSEPTAFDTHCAFRGQNFLYQEDSNRIECWGKGRLLYRWWKGTDCPEISLI